MPPPPFGDIQLGPVELHIYGLILGIGIIAAIQLVDRTFLWLSLPREHLMTIVVPAIVVGFIGARLYHVASKPEFYAAHPDQILAIWKGGLGIYGGVLFGSVTAILIARHFGVRASHLLDAGAPAILLAQAIGRWGNYFNEELYGKRTDLPWALEVTGQPDRYHPTFLYESLWNLLVVVVLLMMIRTLRRNARGLVFATYLALYSIGRFYIEGLRIDPAHEWMGLRQNQWVSLAILAVAGSTAIVLALRARRRA